mgnify:FL=1
MLDERSLTKGEDKKKEKYVKGMKKSFSDFKSRYGDDAKSVMYATATKMAKEETVDEGMGLAVARAIDKTKPPVGRPSKRRKVSDALKMREVDKATAKNKKRKFSGKAAVSEGSYEKFDRTVKAASAAKNPQTKIKLLKVAAQQRPKVAEGYYDSAVQASKDASKTKEAKAGRRNLRVQQTKDTVKKGVQAVGKKVTADATKAMVGGKVQKGPVAASSKPAAKTASPTTTSVTKSQPGMQSKRAPSIPKKPETPKDTQNTQKPQEPKTPQKKKEVNKNAKQGKAGETAKKLGQSAAKAVGGFTAMFDPKESYEQEGELLTFSDFREVVGICNSDAEELEENPLAIGAAMGIAAGGAALIPHVKKAAEKLRNQADKRMGKSPTYKEGTTNESAAWTRKAGKNKEGGLNEKGRKSYEKENPGSDLKAPSKKVGNPRRASFCARMKGMKKKLTSKKTASDPDSRINKSLRAWNC